MDRPNGLKAVGNLRLHNDGALCAKHHDESRPIPRGRGIPDFGVLRKRRWKSELLARKT